MADLLGLVFGSILEGFFVPILKGTGEAVVYCITFGQVEVSEAIAITCGAIVWIFVFAVILKLTL